MPTGYTDPVYSGQVSDFPTFALGCARNFGALIMMRDDPVGAAIPEEFKPHSYHVDAMQAAFTELSALSILSLEEAEERASKQFAEQVKDRQECIARKDEIRERYTVMLGKVLSWQPPTEHHVELKKFMIDQLTESIRFDCSVQYGDIVRLSGHAWLVGELSRVRRDIEYHTKENAEEIARTKQRNEWVKQLRESLS